jgi:fumarate reductase subunit C
MAGWWRRNPFYLWYMARELSCLFVTGYAVVLLWGLYRLSQGRAAFEAWRGTLGTPWSLAFHGVALVLVAYHAWTWFKVMPKTLPFVRIGGHRVADRSIVAAGVAAAAVASIALWLLVWWTRP